ncbi:MAG: hypothetical protein ACYCXA_01195 [Actinomycetes bacterium]
MRGTAPAAEHPWWFCLVHHQVEEGIGCPNRQRLGPYPSREAAEHALDTVARRNEQWRTQDEESGE